jgi:hypothetical protein
LQVLAGRVGREGSASGPSSPPAWAPPGATSPGSRATGFGAETDDPPTRKSAETEYAGAAAAPNDHRSVERPPAAVAVPVLVAGVTCGTTVDVVGGRQPGQPPARPVPRTLERDETPRARALLGNGTMLWNAARGAGDTHRCAFCTTRRRQGRELVRAASAGPFPAFMNGDQACPTDHTEQPDDRQAGAPPSPAPRFVEDTRRAQRLPSQSGARCGTMLPARRAPAFAGIAGADSVIGGIP